MDVIATKNKDLIKFEIVEPLKAGIKSGAKTVSGAQGKISVMVAIPAYNEEVAIGSVVLRSLKYADKVLVIDDGSSDKTSEIARMAGAEVISHKTNMGKGAGIRDAFEYAKTANMDILVLIDGDGQHNPDEIPSLLNPILKNESDIVNGSRFIGNTENHVPYYRRIGQEVLTYATNAGTRIKITDTQNGFRAFSKKTFNIFSFNEKGMAIESEMLLDAAKANLKIQEVPINVRYDVDGSTLNPISHGMGVLTYVIGLVSQRRPLLFFSVPGLAALLVGLFFLVRVLDIFNNTRNMAIGSALIGVLCIIIGIFSMFTGIMLMSIQTLKNNPK